MTDLKGQHISAIALGFLLLASTAKSANAQIRIDKDQTGRIVAMANLSTASGCSRASGRGRVVDHHFENGQMKGVTFKDAKYGESYLNLPLLAMISPASARARVAEGFATLLVKGQDLKVVTLGCGAAGRIEKLTSVELVGPPVRSGSGAAAANSLARPPMVAAAPLSDTGVRSQDGDDSVLRAQDGQAVAAATSSGPQAAPATITGELTYPGEWLPKDLKVCADEVVSKKRTCTSRQQKRGKSIRYELKVPAGTYLVFAESRSQPQGSPAYYSEFVTCGYDNSCQSHRPIPVTVSPGERRAKVDPGDWYANN